MQAFIVLRRAGSLWKSVHRGNPTFDVPNGNHEGWVPFVLVTEEEMAVYETLTEQEALTDIVHRAYGMQDRGRPLAEYAPTNHLIVPLGLGVARVLEVVIPDSPAKSWKVRGMADSDDSEVARR